MKIRFILLISVLFFYSICVVKAQSPTKIKTPPTISTIISVKSSPAYAEVIFQKTELLSQVESLLIGYTEEFPKVKEIRYQISVLDKELTRILAFNSPDAPRLSEALGKLIVKKCEIETDLWNLQKQYDDQHPDVKRAKRKIEIYESAIKDILQEK